MERIQANRIKLIKAKLLLTSSCDFHKRVTGKKQKILVNKLTPTNAVNVCINRVCNLKRINKSQVKRARVAIESKARIKEIKIE